MKQFALLLSDLAVLYGTLVFVLLLRYGPAKWSAQYANHIVPFSILFIVWLFSFYIANLYEQRILRNGRDFYQRLAQATVIAAGLSIIFFYLIPYFGITPKTNLFLFIVIFSILSSGVRFLFNQLIAGGIKKRLLIIGLDDESLELARFVSDNPQFGYAVSGLVRLGQESLPLTNGIAWRIIEDLTDIEEFIRSKHIDTIVISPRAYGMDRVITALYRALAEQVNFASLSGFTERLTGTVPVAAINQTWFLENLSEGSKRSYEVFKRGVDIAAAITLGLPTLLITPLIAAAIKITSPGPVFFCQARTGRGGRPFQIVKFRTMRSDAEKGTGAVWATSNDPRVTKIGRFLRKTRIDELPQMWNILKGDISLVGPRAERPEFDEKLATQIPFYKERYLIKPGATGWAQINYPYVASTQDAIHRLEHDLYYIKRRSLMLDLEIILKTISIALRAVGQ
jgi:exopolysaccharide biosynthesis polyprenyl glycosylphosphotransferase